ncbi:hypothetical protein FHG87_005572 [Trinorchestia longiramus]|nr:hypothetical protein FHG87_005572 [Trinorchestia longiramus]
MEVVSASCTAGGTEVLAAPPPSPFTDGPSLQLRPQDPPPSSTENVKQNVEDDEEEELSRMETETEDVAEESVLSPAEEPAEEESSEVLRAYEEQMECDDNHCMFIDEDSSSSRVFADNDTTSTDSLAVPQQEGRRNKRKNFLPRNIVYNPQDDVVENHHDVTGGGCEDPNMNSETYPSSSSSVNLSNGLGGESPLDLSETPIRRSLLPRRFSPLSLSTANMPQRSGSPPLELGQARSASPDAGESSEMNSSLPDYAQLTMRSLLGLYGLPPHPDLGAGMELLHVNFIF